MTNLDLMKLRAQKSCNSRQQQRMITDKLKSLHRAELYSYQAAEIKKDAENSEWVRALINPDKLKFDYDEKVLSVDFIHGFKAGDTFIWPKGSSTHWIILHQELTELAYFRGNIRRCQSITITDETTESERTVWAAIRGPVETKLDTAQKENIVVDSPNLSLEIYMPLTDENRERFDRYQVFKFDNRYWKVTAMDSISTPGIYQIAAVEDYECHGDELLTPITDPNPEMEEDDYQISGETFIKPLVVNKYHVNSPVTSTWQVALTAEANKEIDDVLDWSVDSNGDLNIKWIAMVSGSFIVKYGLLEKTIIVESLF